MTEWRYIDLDRAGGGTNPPVSPELVSSAVAKSITQELNRSGFNAFTRTVETSVSTPVGSIPFTYSYSVVDSSVSDQRISKLLNAAKNALWKQSNWTDEQRGYILSLFGAMFSASQQPTLSDSAGGFIKRIPVLKIERPVSSTDKENDGITIGPSFKPDGPVVGPLQPDPTNQPPETFGEAQGGFEPTVFFPAFEADPGTQDNSDAPTPDRSLLGWVTLIAGIATIYSVMR